MINIDEKYTLKNSNFPDGSQLMLDVDVDYSEALHEITWKYECDEEIVRLIYIVNHIREKSLIQPTLILNMYYINSARMDRVKSNAEVFTLKYFAGIINSLGFSKVVVYDPHSNVSESLIDRVYVLRDQLRRNIINTISISDSDVVYFPDENAFKKYKDIVPSGIELLYGKKIRNWRTGEIEKIDIVSHSGDSFNIDGKNILVIDDIISKGGSIYHGIKYILDGRYGSSPNSITIYASHIENSIYNEPLWKMFVANKWEIWTTDSIVHSSDVKSNLHFNEIKA